MNILITGGCGFIGSHLVSSLSKEHKVTAIDNLSRGFARPDNCKLIIKDVCAPCKEIENAFRDADVVIHLASKVGSMKYYLSSEYQVLSNNLSIDKSVIELAVKHGVKYFINASSAHVYGISDSKIYESDAWKSKPAITYGISKIVAEELLRSSGLTHASLRLIGIYGPGQDSHIENGSLIPVLCRKLVEGEPYDILTNGEESRSYCYIDDAVEAIMLVLKKMKTEGKSLGPFNVGASTSHTIKHIADTLLKVSQKDTSLVITRKSANVSKQECSVDKILRDVDWSSTTSLEDGLKLTYNYFLNKL